MRRICVFCGSSSGNDPIFEATARELGVAMARRGQALVYGGGNCGLMGAVANAILDAGGEAIGVIPHALEQKELAHHGVTELHIVDTMHERKAMMADLSDGFIAMPGGFGTMEEIFESITWAQLGIHDKPVAFLNVAEYYTDLVKFLDHATTSALLRPQHRGMVIVDSAVPTLLDAMAVYTPPTVEKWITRNEL